MTTNTKKLRGMSLVEIMMVVGIAGVLLAAASSFYVEILRVQMVVQQRLDQAMDIRRFSQELIHNATRANQVILYKSHSAPEDWDDPTDQMDITDGLRPAGDFVVFVYYEFPLNSANGKYHRIQKIVGYYLDKAGGEIGQIKRITIDLSKNLSTRVATPNDQVPAYSTTDKKTMIEEVLRNNTSTNTHTRFDVFAVNARGLFKSKLVDEGFGRLFYLSDAQLSMMVAGQTFARQYTKDRKTYTDTFSFSITPRS